MNTPSEGETKKEGEIVITAEPEGYTVADKAREWEEEFEEKFVSNGKMQHFLHEDVKSFIRTIAKKEYERGYNDAKYEHGKQN